MFLGNGTSGYLSYRWHQPFVLVRFFVILGLPLTLLKSVESGISSSWLKVGSIKGRLTSRPPGRVTISRKPPSKAHSIWNSPNSVVTDRDRTRRPFSNATCTRDSRSFGSAELRI